VYSKKGMVSVAQATDWHEYSQQPILEKPRIPKQSKANPTQTNANKKQTKPNVHE